MSERTRITLPGRSIDGDQRRCVELEVPELPWPLRFYFLPTDEGWANVGFEVGIGPVNAAAAEALHGRDESELAIDGNRVRWLLDHFFRYQASAHGHLDASKNVSRKEGKQRVSPELLARIRAQHEDFGGRRGAIAQLAIMYDVDRSTIHRWLRRTAK
jgi:hypothetical protein